MTEALLTNDAFRGKVDVRNNDLSDLAALHLSKLFAKTSGYNVTQLKLGGNRFTSKAGEYLGEAISSNPNYPIKKVSFKGVCLELIGLTRMVQACNANSHIKKLEIGYLTDTGLRALAEQLVPNVGLEEIIICETEDSQKLWTAAARTAFLTLLKEHTKIKKVSLMSSRDQTEEDKDFQKQVKFYTDFKATRQKAADNYRKILSSCEPQHMFENMQKQIDLN